MTVTRAARAAPVQQSTARPHLAVLGAATALTVALCWPVVRHLRTVALSNGGDGSSALWGQWYLPHAALGGHNPVGATRALFWPVGANLVLHSSAPLPTLLATPLVHSVGLVAAFNLGQLAAMVLSLYATWLLAMHVTGDSSASFFAGVAFALVPYRFVHMGSHVNLIHVELLPLAWLAALRVLERPTRERGAVLGAAVAAAVLTDFTVAAIVLVGLIAIAAVHGGLLRRAARSLAAALVVAGILTLPLLVTAAVAIRNGETSRIPGLGGAEVYSADLYSWLLPSDHQPLWGHVFASVRNGLSAGGEGVAFPGFCVLVLAYLAVKWSRRAGDGPGAQMRTFFLIACAGVILSLGPFLLIDGRAFSWITVRGVRGGLPLPFLGVAVLPLLDNLRVPGRFSILGIAGFDVLAAVGLAELRRRHPERAGRLAVVLVGLVILELLPGSLPLTSAHIPAPYAAIAADRSRGAVLELPMQWRSGFEIVGDDHPLRDDTLFLYYATRDHRPLVSGMVARLSDRRLADLLAIPLYRQVLAGEGHVFPPPQAAPALSFGAGDLRSEGISFVVCHRDVPEPALCDHVAALGLRVLADDGTVTVWKVPDSSGRT